TARDRLHLSFYLTRSVLAGSKEPVRARARRTRQAPRVVSSQYVWQRKVPQNLAMSVVRATLTGFGKYGVRLSMSSCVTMPPTQMVRPSETDGNAMPSVNSTGYSAKR